MKEAGQGRFERRGQAAKRRSWSALPAVLSVTALVKSAQSEKFPKGHWEIEVQEQNPVLSTGEGSGNPQIQFAETLVFPLGETAPEPCDAVILFVIPVKDKADGESSDGHAVFRTASPLQAVHESREHFPAWEGDA